MTGVGAVLKKKVLKHLLTRGESTARQIQEATGKTRQAVLLAIAELMEAGVVEARNAGAGRVYTVSDQARAAAALASMDLGEFIGDAAGLLAGSLSAVLLGHVHPLAPLASAPLLLTLVLKYL